MVIFVCEFSSKIGCFFVRIAFLKFIPPRGEIIDVFNHFNVVIISSLFEKCSLLCLRTLSLTIVPGVYPKEISAVSDAQTATRRRTIS